MNYYSLVAVLIWSLLAAFTVNVTGLPPLFLTGLALTIGGFITLIGFKQWKWNSRYFFISVLSLFFYHFFLFLGFQKGHPLVVNFLNYLWPVLIIIFSALLNPTKKITTNQVVGVIVAFAGCGLIFLSFKNAEGDFHVMGYVFAMLAAMIWALYSNLIEKFKTMSSWNVGPATFGAGLLALLASKLMGEVWSIEKFEAPWVVLLGIGPMGIAFVLWQAGIKRHGVRSVASLSYLTPVLSSLWLSMAINQPLSPTLVFALVLVLMGTWISSQKKST